MIDEDKLTHTICEVNAYGVQMGILGEWCEDGDNTSLLDYLVETIRAHISCGADTNNNLYIQVRTYHEDTPEAFVGGNFVFALQRDFGSRSDWIALQPIMTEDTADTTYTGHTISTDEDLDRGWLSSAIQEAVEDNTSICTQGNDLQVDCGYGISWYC